MELLIVVVVLAVLMAVALPAYLAAQSDSKAKACRANMMTIANNEREYKLKSSTHSYTTNLSDLATVLPIVPLCPDGGTYTLITNGTALAQNGQAVPNGWIVVSCNKHGNFALDIDSN